GLQSHRPELLDGMGVIVGIDKFMSECRALTNFTGNAVATLLIGNWTGEIDMDQARATLSGQDPFDELSLEPDVHGAPTNAPEADAALPEPQTTVAADNQAKATIGN
ncbi:MAG: C4-dicarboxylate transporter DctA, partial [Arthrobacter rhombi]